MRVIIVIIIIIIVIVSCRVTHLPKQIPSTKATTPIFRQGPVVNAVFEGTADPDGPSVEMPVAEGVAKEVAVPSTPLSVASPSAAACEAEDNLPISLVGG